MTNQLGRYLLAVFVGDGERASVDTWLNRIEVHASCARGVELNRANAIRLAHRVINARGFDVGDSYGGARGRVHIQPAEREAAGADGAKVDIAFAEGQCFVVLAVGARSTGGQRPTEIGEGAGG
mgnify:CR=1 FL=1